MEREAKRCAFGKKCKADADCVTCFCNGVTCDALTLATAQGAAGVAVDAASVYWTDMGAGTVAKAPIGGGGASLTLAFGQNGAKAIALDAKSVYFATTDRVMSVPIDGGAPTMIASGQTTVVGLTVDATLVYWTVNGGSGGSVMSAPLVGGMQPATVAVGMRHPGGVAVDAMNAYWPIFSGILKAPIGGGTPGTIASSTDGTAIVVNGGSVYWTAWAAGTATLASVPMDGDGGAPVILASETSTAAPLGLAVDPDHVYWTDAANGTVMRVPISGGPPVNVAGGQDSPKGIVVDATYVYWAGGAAVKKACK
jgi:hypothetical protein